MKYALPCLAWYLLASCVVIFPIRCDLSDFLHPEFPLIILSPRRGRVSPFLAWGDFHARSREKWGTTRSLVFLGVLK